MAYGSKTITTNATLIADASTARHSIVISNAGSNIVYIGPDSSVTTSNGIPLQPDSIWDADSGGVKLYMGAFYAIVASGTSDIRYWERTDLR